EGRGLHGTTGPALACRSLGGPVFDQMPIPRVEGLGFFAELPGLFFFGGGRLARAKAHGDDHAPISPWPMPPHIEAPRQRPPPLGRDRETTDLRADRAPEHTCPTREGAPHDLAVETLPQVIDLRRPAL